MSTSKVKNHEYRALEIYVISAIDITDSIDMINEEEIETLQFLHKMLTGPPGASTDTELNKILTNIVANRIKKLSS